MQNYLHFFIDIPLIGYLICLFVHKTDERRLSRVAFSTMAVHFLASLVFAIIWYIKGHQRLYLKWFTVYKCDGFEMNADVLYDNITATYLLVGSAIAFLITAFSRTYLHREQGFKRFFTTILLFYLAYNFLVLSGNFVTFFIGWEVAGISSFLLIGFYRNRYLPIKNALKVFSIYKIGDIALILAAWASHHIWHQNAGMTVFNDQHQVTEHIHHYQNFSLFYCILVLMAASIKSAQFPFSSWLPRAMEGPTPSSAIFYSSLSAHAGLLLLLRTDHFWQNVPGMKIAVICVGAITFIISSMTARVQSTIKAKIAYSTTAQIGLMFIEVAFDLEWLVLIHFAGNAFLRSYQLLVSPSAVTYLIREQFYNYIPVTTATKNGMRNKIKNTLYILCTEEWFMDQFMHQSIWNFLKKIGRRLHFINLKFAIIAGSLLLVSYVVIALMRNHFDQEMLSYIPISVTSVGLLFALRSFTEKKNVFLVLGLSLTTHIFNASVIIFSSHANLSHVIIYLSGIVISLVPAILALIRLTDFGVRLNVKWYQGHCYEHPKTNMVFLVSSLGLMGFPITASFLGIELMYTYIEPHQIYRLVFVSLGLLVNNLSLIRLYSRVFLGPHIRNYHESALKSS